MRCYAFPYIYRYIDSYESGTVLVLVLHSSRKTAIKQGGELARFAPCQQAGGVSSRVSGKPDIRLIYLIFLEIYYWGVKVFEHF